MSEFWNMVDVIDGKEDKHVWQEQNSKTQQTPEEGQRTNG